MEQNLVRLSRWKVAHSEGLVFSGTQTDERIKRVDFIGGTQSGLLKNTYNITPEDEAALSAYFYNWTVDQLIEYNNAMQGKYGELIRADASGHTLPDGYMGYRVKCLLEIARRINIDIDGEELCSLLTA